MNVQGITWHSITTDDISAWRKLAVDTLGLQPAVEMDGFVMFAMANGSMLELYGPDNVPPYELNASVAFGFRVDDIEKASQELEAAGYELLGDVNTMEDIKYSWRHFRGPDGKVYGLNQQS